MAKVSIHSLLRELRGNVDGLVIRKIRGQYFIGRKPTPDRKRKPTAGQQAFRARFGRASNYAKAVQRDPALHAFYAPLAKKRDLRVRALAISDWFHPPKVESIDLRHYRGRAGDVITIRATDNFGVVRVLVSIDGPDRTRLEHGAAVLQGKSWRYTATTTLTPDQPVIIQALAYDRPNNHGELKVPWSIK